MHNPIRVLHVFGSLDIGGAESRTMDIYRAVNKEVVQFDFAIHTYKNCFFENEIKQLGGRIYHLPKFYGFNYFKIRKNWADFFSSHKEYQIIHAHQTSLAFIYLWEAKKQNIPIRIAHARNASKDLYIKKITTKLAKFYATDLLAVSTPAAIDEFGIKNVNKNKVSIIKNAIPVKKYKFNHESRNQLRSELNIPSDSAVFCHVGRFHPQKNHNFLIKIFYEIQTQLKNSVLLLIGEGSEKSSIEELVQSLNIEDKVLFLGIRNDINKILSSSDVMVFPSLYEGLPGVILEAQAANLPCIISDTITDEVIINPTTIAYSLSNSPRKWANLIINIYNSTITKRDSNQTKMLNSGFNINDIAIWYQNYYQTKIEEI